MNCKTCGAKSQSEYCFLHKPRKALKRSAIKKTTKKKPRGRIKRYREDKDTDPKRKRSVRSLKSLVWTQFAKFIRLRDSDERGIFKCVYCRAEVYWKYGDTCHFKKAKHSNTWINEKNNNGGCPTCNQIKDHLSNEAEKIYKINIDKKWGPGTAEELDILSKTSKRFSVPELEDLLKHYTGEVRRLLKEKNLRP